MKQSIARKKDERERYIVNEFEAEAISSKSIKFDVYNQFVSDIKELGEAYKSSNVKKKVIAAEEMLDFLKAHKLIYESIFNEKIKEIHNLSYGNENMLRNDDNEDAASALYKYNNTSTGKSIQQLSGGEQAIDTKIEFIFSYLILNKQRIALNIEAEDIINNFSASARGSNLIKDFVVNFKEFKHEFEMDHKQANTDRLINTAIDLNMFLQDIGLDRIIKTITNNNYDTFLDARLKLLQKTLSVQLMKNSNEKEDSKVIQGVDESIKSLLEVVAENTETIKYMLTNIEIARSSMIASQLRL
jgi:hypothetical protein